MNHMFGENSGLLSLRWGLEIHAEAQRSPSLVLLKTRSEAQRRDAVTTRSKILVTPWIEVEHTGSGKPEIAPKAPKSSSAYMADCRKI